MEEDVKEPEEHHPAPLCEDQELEHSQAFGLKVASVAVCTIPPLYMVAVMFHMPVDDRILLASLAGIATILAFGFKKG